MGVGTHKDRPGADSHRPWLPGNGSTNNPAAPQTETNAQQLLAPATNRFKKIKTTAARRHTAACPPDETLMHTSLQWRRRSARPESGGNSAQQRNPFVPQKHPPWPLQARGTGTPVKVFASLSPDPRNHRAPTLSFPPFLLRATTFALGCQKRGTVMSRSPNHYHHCNRTGDRRQPITRAKEGRNKNK